MCSTNGRQMSREGRDGQGARKDGWDTKSMLVAPRLLNPAPSWGITAGLPILHSEQMTHVPLVFASYKFPSCSRNSSVTALFSEHHLVMTCCTGKFQCHRAPKINAGASNVGHV